MIKNVHFAKAKARFLVAVLFAASLLFISSSVAYASLLYRELQLGMSGSDVSSLQTFLAKDKTIYPKGQVTGYFGTATKSAVINFQKKNGISAIGRVGPATLKVLNKQMGNVASSSANSAPLNNPVVAPAIVVPTTTPTTTVTNTNTTATSTSSVIVTSGDTTLTVSLVPLLSGGTAHAGKAVPVSYLQITNIGKDSATLTGFWIKQNGSASTQSIIGLTTVDDKGGSRGSVGGVEGATPFKDGMAFAPTNATFAPGQMRLFTIKAVLSANISSYIGKQLMIDVTSIETNAKVSGAFPIVGTTWTLAN